jgi:uncharacterized protein YjiK
MARTRRVRHVAPLLALLLVTTMLTLVSKTASASPADGIDLSQYVRVGRYDLPEPTRTTPPAGSLLAQEASAVTYDWDTDTLFVVGDGGTSVVQVSKTGQLIDSMTLAAGTSPQGTEFYDTEGLTYAGGGKFVLSEERYRQVVRFTYVAGGTLTRAATETVDLGPDVGNIGNEGVAYDPVTAGLILVKEKTPEAIFGTTVNWGAGTATNGSATTEPTNLFDPSLVGTSDLSDVYAMANIPGIKASEHDDLLIISQEAGKVLHVNRSGVIKSSLTITADQGNPLSVQAQTFEGVTADSDGRVYVVNEQGGGDFDHPQLWVYALTSATNAAPTGAVLSNRVTSVPENTVTPLKVADITVLDDGLGTNDLTLSGTDASSFQITGGQLFVKSGVALDYETKASYSVTVNVDDASVGATPDATVAFTLALTDVVNETAPDGTVAITEVAPWGSASDTTYKQDWWELTNLGSTTVNLTGWKVDDNSYNLGSVAVPLRGTWSSGTSSNPLDALGPGESYIFLESGGTPAVADNTLIGSFQGVWWPSGPVPTNVHFGVYGGSGVGLSTGGDAVEVFSASVVGQASVSFGATTTASPYASFDNSAAVGARVATTNPGPAPVISTASVVGTRGAYQVGTTVLQKGSPGVDSIAPSFTGVPFGTLAEATSASGAAVTYAAPTATDLLDGARTVGCAPASGSTFALGTTTVTCTASDTKGNTGTTTFLVRVRDTTAPVVNLPTSRSAASSGGPVTVNFGPVTATDAVDGTITATCSPASGSSFPVGSTHVDCYADDSQLNRGTALMDVVVSAPAAPTTTTTSTTSTTVPAGSSPTTTIPSQPTAPASPSAPAVAVPGGVVVIRDGEPVRLPITLPPNVRVAAAAATPSGNGAWVVTPQGKVVTTGDAPAIGSIKGNLNKPIVGMASTPSGEGYWLLGADGGVFSFGDAAFKGSTGNRVLNKPITTLSSTASGKGYWLVASDGGVFTFGDAAFHGSTGGRKLDQPVVSIAATPSGDGYWLVGRSGGVYAFGDATNEGSGSKGKTIVAIVPSPSGNGYWLMASDGSTIAFGDAGK